MSTDQSPEDDLPVPSSGRAGGVVDPAASPPPKRLVRATRELLREAAQLVKRKGKRLSAEHLAEVEAAMQAAAALLPKRGKPQPPRTPGRSPVTIVSGTRWRHRPAAS